MGDDLPEASNLVSSDTEVPVSDTCEDEDQDEDEMLRRAIDLSLTNDDATVCEPRRESNLEDYQYSPLPSTDKTIRLLCIPPADHISDPLVCQMRQVRLIDKPEYAALSYTWGAPVFDHHIICDGRRLAITAHLDAALRRFRTTTWWIWTLWVDAVCIDQTNIPERNYQVSIMKHIYDQATMTFVYLGEACLHYQVALQLMCNLVNIAQLIKKYSLAELKDTKPLDALTPGVRDFLIRFIELKDAGFPTGFPAASTGTTNSSSAGIPPPTDPAWRAMQSLLSRPWFSRMWIIQEVVMSSNVIMMLGKFCFPWRLLIDSVSAYVELGLLPLTKLPNMAVAGRFHCTEKVVLSLLKVKVDFQCRSLIKLLGYFQQCYSSDPRDKVYALLGLAANDQGAHQMVSVDYSKSVEAVYLECAQFLVRNRDGMEMLIQAGIPQNRGDDHFKISLPSWVPDWSREKFNYFQRCQDLDRAAGETQSDIEVEDCGNGLNVRGIRIDVVDSLAPVLTEDENKGGYLRSKLFAWEQEVREVAQQSCFFSEERVDDYANALGAGSCHRADVNIANNSVDFLLECFWNRRPAKSNKDNEEYLGHVGTTALNHKFCVTRQGYMGWVPLSSQPGDFIIVLYGGPLPFTVRKTDGKYLLLGAGYLEGFMNGEALELKDAEPEVFVLE